MAHIQRNFRYTLMRGQPGPALLGLTSTRDLLQEYSKAEDEVLLRALQYDQDSQGDPKSRETIAKFVNSRRSEKDLVCQAENLVVTNGVSSGVELVCSSFGRRGDRVLVEKYSYFLSFGIFRSHGFEIVTLEDEELNLEEFEKKVEDYKIKFVYLITPHNNPTGRSLNFEKRRKICRLAREKNFSILVDEIYQFLNFNKAEERFFSSAEDGGRVFCLNSFNKIFAPGIRLGWIETDKKSAKELAKRPYLISGGSLANFSLSLLSRGLTTGLISKHLDGISNELSVRAKVLKEELEKAGFTPTLEPRGGYFIFARFPQICVDKNLTAEELRKQTPVDFLPASETTCSTENEDFQYFGRFSFAFHDSEEIREAVRLLREYLDSVA